MSTQPFEIDVDRLFAKIGRLVVENELLREQLATQAASLPVVLDEATLERAGTALVNADAREPNDRPDGRWRPAVLAEAVLRAAVSGPESSE